ncbi:hypothetical protein AB6E71_05410 [Staphylococcus arlettae]|uniref:hypothetical protein n=1 Tax=Staphylococcus arlettae TaxID=29378 RepID=UPI0034DDBCE7
MTKNYKERVLSEFTQLAIDERDNTYFDIAQEVEEVYRKAKAFDEILNIEDNYNKQKGFSPCVEEYTEDVEDIISKYMESADDER